MSLHNPVEFATSLSAKLATRSRHVCAFLGAGVGCACGLPDVVALQDRVLSGLDKRSKAAFASQLNDRNLEEALSRLRRIAALVTGDQTVDDLTRGQAEELDRAACKVIVEALDLEDADLKPMQCFAAWVARADYHLPIEVFTVNYDLLIETALEDFGVPYFDGFMGTMQASFHTQLVESSPGSGEQCLPSLFVRLWKLHGSVNWVRAKDRGIVRLGQPVQDGRAAAIYPSDTKYEESRRVPFVVLHDRLRRALYQPETLVIVTGYSFGDSHLNELIFDAASRRERSEFVVFCHGCIPPELADCASRMPNLQVTSAAEAILGGIRAKWETPEDPPPNLWEDSAFGLGDFRNLAAYLARSATHQPGGSPLLRELIESISLGDSTDRKEKSDA